MTSPARAAFHAAASRQRAGRIEHLSWWRVALPLRRKLRHASADASSLESIVVRAVVDGAVGHAEVRTNGAYATGETHTDVQGAFRTGEVTGMLVRESVGGLLKTSRLAALAVDVAAWDALARREHVPLGILLGGDPSLQSIRTHGAIAFGSVDEATELAAQHADAGFARVKVRIGGDPALDLARVTAVRRTVGASCEIIVDANGGWQVDQALSALDQLSDLGVTWFEQPSTGLEALQTVTEAAHGRPHSGTVRIRADESVTDAASVRQIASGTHVDGVHLKLEKAGSVERLVDAVDTARRAGLAVALGQMDQGRLGCAATAHVAAGLQIGEAELWGWANVTEDIAGPLTVERGAVVLPTGPGLGVDVTLPNTPEGIL